MCTVYVTVTVAATPTRPVRRQLSDRDRQSSPTGNIRSSSVSINPRHKKNSFKGRKRTCLFVCLFVVMFVCTCYTISELSNVHCT